MFPSAGPACLIDWAMPAIGFGEIDVAHALVLNLTPEQQRRYTTSMKERYARNRERSDPGFNRAAFEARYALAVRFAALSPVLWWAGGLAETVWRTPLANVMTYLRQSVGS